ncbi:hypothetical protein Pelo_18427 [Pelomyxa schiedti]|nr:hypothetical protein Pelo_18427 [Pelomyxa schiedti]
MAPILQALLCYSKALPDENGEPLHVFEGLGMALTYNASNFIMWCPSKEEDLAPLIIFEILELFGIPISKVAIRNLSEGIRYTHNFKLSLKTVITSMGL